MAAKKLENMEDKEFMDAWTSLGKKVQEDKEKLKEFSQEHQRRVRVQQLRDMGLTQADLELLQEAGPEGIESEEDVDNG